MTQYRWYKIRLKCIKTCHYTWESSQLVESSIIILNVNYDTPNIDTLFKRFQHASQKTSHVTWQTDHSKCSKELVKLYTQLKKKKKSFKLDVRARLKSYPCFPCTCGSISKTISKISKKAGLFAPPPNLPKKKREREIAAQRLGSPAFTYIMQGTKVF